MPIEIDIQNASDATDLPEKEEFHGWVEMALNGHRKQAELTIRLVDEPESRELNEQFRGRDEPTNILSFPYDAPAVVSSDLLGDLVICVPLVRREAAAQGKNISAHWAHLVVHGTLHLLGFDHQSDQEASLMEGVEVHILSRLGFPDPYLDDEKP